jgi:hypothetical protein
MFRELLAVDIDRQQPREKSGIIEGFGGSREYTKGPIMRKESKTEKKGKERKAIA